MFQLHNSIYLLSGSSSHHEYYQCSNKHHYCLFYYSHILIYSIICFPSHPTFHKLSYHQLGFFPISIKKSLSTTSKSVFNSYDERGKSIIYNSSRLNLDSFPYLPLRVIKRCTFQVGAMVQRLRITKFDIQTHTDDANENELFCKRCNYRQ